MDVLRRFWNRKALGLSTKAMCPTYWASFLMQASISLCMRWVRAQHASGCRVGSLQAGWPVASRTVCDWTPTGVFFHLSSTPIVRSQMCWASFFFFCIRFPCIFTFVNKESVLKCSLEDGPMDGEAQRKTSRNLLELLPPGTDEAQGSGVDPTAPSPVI